MKYLVSRKEHAMKSLIQCAIAILAATVALTCFRGCTIVTPIAVIVEGPPTIEAQYPLQDRPTVVFVDDRRNILADRAIRRYIGDEISKHLLAHKVVTDAISTGDAHAIANNEQHGELIPIEQIGRDVGAAQVIYIEILRFAMEAPDGQPTAQADLQVKVIDVEIHERLFPPEDAENSSYYMPVMLPPDQAFQPMLGRGARTEAEYTLANLIADKVAKLFYEHERHTGSPSGLAPRTSQ